ncbi:hypothetical protein Fmac_026382 [Flemingia macrophylla]|uniref:Uncharacterized protein n=1 Tax=Flemingia macrophylla TaxID=520843 RepID=A0ABD1LEP9_9FABA
MFAHGEEFRINAFREVLPKGLRRFTHGEEFRINALRGGCLVLHWHDMANNRRNNELTEVVQAIREMKTHLPRTLNLTRRDDLMYLRDDLNTRAPSSCRSSSLLSRSSCRGTETELGVQDMFAMTDSPTRILTQWNKNNQPVGDSSSLLASFLGQVTSNFGNFPVLYENWTQVPEQYKNNVYVNTIHDIANKNVANRAKLVIPHILGSKTLARKRDELETIHGREFSRAEIYQLSHKKPNGTFVNEEARELHEKLQEEMQHCSENEAFLRVCRTEHPGYMRGMGLGVSPSQIIGSSSGATSSSTSFESNERIKQMQAEIQSLKAQVIEIDSLKAQVAEVDVLKQQIAFLMQRAKEMR